jgi:hypothetical protein
MTDRTSLRDAVIGNSYQIERTVSDVPAGETATDAWFTLKRRLTDSDAHAVLQKHITVASVIATGVVINDSPSSGTAILQFNIGPDDWAATLPQVLHHYDIKMKTSGGAEYTFEFGDFVAEGQVTGTE